MIILWNVHNRSNNNNIIIIIIIIIVLLVFCVPQNNHKALDSTKSVKTIMVMFPWKVLTL